MRATREAFAHGLRCVAREVVLQARAGGAHRAGVGEPERYPPISLLCGMSRDSTLSATG